MDSGTPPTAFPIRGLQLQDATATIHHPWSLVVRSHWLKYPNAKNPTIQNVDTLSRTLTPSGALFSRRLASCYAKPHWMLRSILGSYVSVVEDSVILLDPVPRFVIVSRNLTFRSMVQGTEYIEYRPNPDNPEETLMTHRLMLDSPLPTSFHRFLLDFADKMFTRNSAVGLEIIDDLCNRFHDSMSTLGEHI